MEVNRLMDEVGLGGGFILAPSHTHSARRTAGKRAGRLPDGGETAGKCEGLGIGD